MTTSISCVLWERGLLSVLKRNEAEQMCLAENGN
jgi:hypothetical protein